MSESNALALIRDVESMEMAKRIPVGTHEPTPENVEEWWSSRLGSQMSQKGSGNT